MRYDDLTLYKELECILEEMNHEVDVIIVEGSRDERAIRKMGFEKDIIRYSDSKLRDVQFVDKVAKLYDCVTILTDYDRAGKRANKRLSVQLESLVRLEKRYRAEIGSILGLSGMKTIESIHSLGKRLFG